MPTRQALSYQETLRVRILFSSVKHAGGVVLFQKIADYIDSALAQRSGSEQPSKLASAGHVLYL